MFLFVILSASYCCQDNQQWAATKCFFSSFWSQTLLLASSSHDTRVITSENQSPIHQVSILTSMSIHSYTGVCVCRRCCLKTWDENRLDFTPSALKRHWFYVLLQFKCEVIKGDPRLNMPASFTFGAHLFMWLSPALLPNSPFLEWQSTGYIPIQLIFTIRPSPPGKFHFQHPPIPLSPPAK